MNRYRKILFLVSFLLTAYSAHGQSRDTLKYRYGFGPSILTNVTQLKMNGDYEVFTAGFGIGLSFKRENLFRKSYGSVPWEIGVYISPRFSQKTKESDGVLSLIFHSTIFESFGIGLGVNVWKTGIGLVKAYKEDIFFTIGYSLTNQTLSENEEKDR